MKLEKNSLRPPNLSARGKKRVKSPVSSDIPTAYKEPPKISINNEGLKSFTKQVKDNPKEVKKRYKNIGYNIEDSAGELCVTKIPSSPFVTLELSHNDWVFGEADMVASWNVEDDGITITHNSLDYINKKAEGIRSADLVKYYDSFIGAWVFKNHEQKEEVSKGVILDATLRTIEIGTREVKDSDGKVKTEDESIFYTRGLLAVNRADDKELSKAFEEGKILYGSMGNLYFNKQCSYCGHKGLKAANVDTRCIHMKLALGQFTETAYGKRKIVEFWSPEDNKGNERFIQFYEYSLLTISPAFNGSRVWRQQTIDILKPETNVTIQVEEKYLKKEAFQKYIKNGQIKIIKGV